MQLDDAKRCAGTLQPGRTTVLGLCLGCARWTLRRADMHGLAFEAPATATRTSGWDCAERRSMGVVHPSDAAAPRDAGAPPNLHPVPTAADSSNARLQAAAT